MVLHGLKRIFQKPTPDLSSSDRTNQLRSKTVYAGTVELSKTLEKNNNRYQTYNGPFEIAKKNVYTDATLVASASYKDLLDITKGKVLLNQLPLTDLTYTYYENNFGNGEMYTGNYQQFNGYNNDGPTGCASSVLVYDLSTTGFTGPGSYDSNSIGNTGPSGMLGSSQHIFIDPKHCYLNPCNSPDSYMNFVDINFKGPTGATGATGITGPSQYFAQQILDANQYSGFRFPMSNFTLTCKQRIDSQAEGPLFCPAIFIPILNDSPPLLSGPLSMGVEGTSSVRVGSIITTTSGTWSINPTSYTYRWYRGNSQVFSQTTSRTTASYTTVSDDATFLITSQVVATDAQGDSAPAPSNPIDVIPFAPEKSTAPSISGPASVGVGSKLTTSNGTWSNKPTSFTYQWYRGANPIPSKTTASYTTVSDDANLSVTCQVVATNTGGASAPVTSNSIAVVLVPAISTAPSIPGPASVGVGIILTTTSGTWSNTPTSYTYQWFRGTTKLSSQTTSQITASYTTISDDATFSVTCQVVATNAGGASDPATSNPIAVVLVPAISTAPSISGPASVGVGKLLTTNNGTWSSNTPITLYTYQWYRGTTKLSSQTTSQTTDSYTTVSGDIGLTITCQVVATNAGGDSLPAPSNQIAVVPPPSFVAVSQSIGQSEPKINSIQTSSNGIDWMPVTNSTSILVDSYGVAYNNGLWVAVGGDDGLSASNTIATSINGIDWMPVTNSSNIFTLGLFVVFTNKLWVALGRGDQDQFSIATSTTGVDNWVGVQGSNSILNIGKGAAYGVVNFKELWVAVGWGDKFSIATSNDGLVWKGVEGSNLIFSNNDGGRGNHVAYNNGLWVAVGKGTYSIATSTNGTDWIGVQGSNLIFQQEGACVAYNNGLWVAIGFGNNFSIATSTTGVDKWVGVAGSSSLIKQGSCVAYDNKLRLWVAVGSGGTNSIATSLDGLVWTGRGSATSTDIRWVSSQISIGPPAPIPPPVPVISATAPPPVISGPVISGLPSPSVYVGSILTTTSGTWSSNTPITSYIYQWYRGTTKLSSQTTSQTTTSYTTVSDDATFAITCQVVATNPGGDSLPATSNPINVIWKKEFIYNIPKPDNTQNTNVVDIDASPIFFTWTPTVNIQLTSYTGTINIVTNDDTQDGAETTLGIYDSNNIQIVDSQVQGVNDGQLPLGLPYTFPSGIINNTLLVDKDKGPPSYTFQLAVIPSYQNAYYKYVVNTEKNAYIGSIGITYNELP